MQNIASRYGLLALLLVIVHGLACATLPADETDADIKIDADYPGGNVIVDRIEGDDVYLKPDLRDTAGWWFYWNFRVKNAAGRSLTFRFAGQNPIGTRGPAVSTDDGILWKWLGTDNVNGGSFQYTFDENQNDVRFAFAIPYLQKDLQVFTEKHKDDANLRVDELCKSSKDRSIEQVYAGKLDGEPEYRVLLTARHHACESIADYVLEGFLAEVLADSETGQWYRENVEVMAIPFVDKDGVEDGDQGKNRRPHDHNRDYIEQVHPSVKAIVAQVPKWSDGKLKVSLDLHCPWIRGPDNEVIYMVGSRDPQNWQEQMKLGKLLEAESEEGLPYHVRNNLAFGDAWNTGTGSDKLMTNAAWARSIKGIQIATTIEVPYANVERVTVTPDGARDFGRKLATAVRKYLEAVSQLF